MIKQDIKECDEKLAVDIIEMKWSTKMASKALMKGQKLRTKNANDQCPPPILKAGTLKALSSQNRVNAQVLITSKTRH